VAKRVSLQGKGVELFFGGRGPNEDSPASPTETDERSTREANTRTRARTPDVDQLFRGLDDKQRLASSTFRFQPEELEQLDELFEEANRARPRKVSKNDLVRLGLRWLLSDYEANPTGSLVGQLLRRV
jgi:hypothetical protein